MRSSIKWLPTTLDPRKMIAEPTLNALRVLLGSTAGRRRNTTGAGVAVRLQDYPVLGEVGGVTRVESVGVARIGSSSYVAYEIGDEGLKELPVSVDSATGTLRIGSPAE